MAANNGWADIVIVGSETLRRGDLIEAQLLGHLQRVRSNVPAGVAVTTADTYDQLLAHPAIIAASDIVMPNIYPYWERYALESAIPALDAAYRRVVAAAGGKPVVISETGWPSGGNPQGNAVPSPANAAEYFLQFASWARANNVPYYYFSSFDENWKIREEGPQGAYWGIWNSAGAMKPGMEAVFNGQTAPAGCSAAGVPGIRIGFDFVGPAGDTRPVYGRAFGVNPADYKVAVYLQVGSGWWNKPTWAAPLTSIGANCAFSAEIVTGGNDAQGTRVRAYLVPNGYAPPAVSGQGLPAELDAYPWAEAVRGAHAICGTVRASGGTPIGGAIVALSGAANFTARTISTGQYCFANLTAGAAYSVTASVAGYLPSAPVSIPSLNGVAAADFTVPQIPAPGPASPLRPANGAAGVSRTVRLAWSTNGQVESNDVYFGTVDPPPFLGAAGAANDFPAPLLEPQRTYYWRVVSRNAAGAMPSPVWSFTTGMTYPANDADGNGVSDLYWMNDETRQVTLWRMNASGGALGWGWVHSTGVPRWTLAGSGLFDDDGIPDLVWADDDIHKVTVWYMAGAQGAYSNWGWINQFGMPEWTIVGVADFNRDGKPDLLWQNERTRQVDIQYLWGNLMGGYASLEKNGIPGWRVAGIGDFDRDGILDVLWQNDATRQVTLWYMTGRVGNELRRWEWISSAGVPGWRLAGAGDMNGDGTPDLLWQNDATRQVTTWHMGGPDGNVVTGWAWIAAQPMPGWTVAVP